MEWVQRESQTGGRWKGTYRVTNWWEVERDRESHKVVVGWSMDIEGHKLVGGGKGQRELQNGVKWRGTERVTNITSGR